MATETGVLHNSRSRIVTPLAGNDGAAHVHFQSHQTEGCSMLRWALVFFVVALVAAVLGFTGIALASAEIAKVLFYLFFILFVLSLLGHVARRP